MGGCRLWRSGRVATVDGQAGASDKRGFRAGEVGDKARDLLGFYAAFGDRHALFRKALDRYVNGPAAYVGEALKAPTARGVVERLLRGAVGLLTDPRNPRGCLLVQGALACGEAASPIRKEPMARRAAGEAALRQRLKRAKSTGDLPTDPDPAHLARTS
jgi:hypothetical protein